MKEEVRVCVEARIHMFDQYFIVPPAMQGEVEGFIAEITALGERSSDAATFEADFASSGLSDRFNALLPQLTPKAAAPSPELKEVKKQAMKETNPAKDWGKHAAKGLFDHFKYVLARETRHRVQKKMIENDTFDDFTRLSNLADDIETLNEQFKK